MMEYILCARMAAMLPGYVQEFAFFLVMCEGKEHK
jgi:hypothetical protein